MVVVNRQKKKSVSEFLGQYSTASTRKSYRAALRKFFVYIYPELVSLYPKTKNRNQMAEALVIFDKLMNELSLEYVQNQDQDYEADLIGYRDLIINVYAPKTLASTFACIFKYLETNSLEFTKDWRKNLIGKVGQKGISRERLPTPTELNRILYYLPPQGRALTFTLATGGMRVDEALQLKISDLELEYIANFLDDQRQMVSVPISKINLRAETTKSREERFTYITTEARIEMDRWLASRQGYIQKLRALKIEPDESLVFPFTYATFRELWKTAITKAGLYDLDTRTNRITVRIHTLRKFFRTWGGWKNSDVPECLMGHQKGMSAIYAQPAQAERLLVEGYKDAEPNLTMSESVIIERPSEEMEIYKGLYKQTNAILEIAEENIKELKSNLDKSIGDITEIREENKKLQDDMTRARLVDKDSVEDLQRTVSELKRTIELMEPTVELARRFIEKESGLDRVVEPSREP